MPTEYQMKSFGKWRDIQLPWPDLNAIQLSVERYGGAEEGRRLNREEMKPFLDVARENWGCLFQGGDETTNGAGLELKLDLDCVMVLANRHDTLKLAVCWEVSTELPEREGNRRWDKASGFIEITLLPGN